MPDPQKKSTFQYREKKKKIFEDRSPPSSSLHSGEKHVSIIYVIITKTFSSFSFPLFFPSISLRKERILVISMNSGKKKQRKPKNQQKYPTMGNCC